MDKEERFNYYINKKDVRDWFIDDRVKEEEITTFKGVVEVLNNQDQRIAELEEQLKNLKEKYVSIINENVIAFNKLEKELENAIVPKFKPHNDLFVIVGYKDEPKSIEQYYIDEIVVRGNGKYIEYRDIEKETIIGENNFLFATKEEAQAKLEELGERDVKD